MARKGTFILLIFLVIISLFGVSGCGSVAGSSNIVTREMSYSNFTKVEASTAFQVTISRGDTFSVSIRMDDNLFSSLDIRQSGKTLHIGLKQPRLYIHTTQQAVIVMPELEELDVSGASRGEVSGFITAVSRKLSASGASHLVLHDLQSADATVKVSGASEATGSLKADTCDFEVSGASSLELDGSTSTMALVVSGASKARLFDFEVSDASARLSGASGASIDVRSKLDAEISGASSLSYEGSPVIGKLDISGASSIHKVE